MRRGDADLNILVGAVGLSALGDWIALVPLTIHLQEASGSGLTIAALYFAIWAPSVVLAGPAGLLADRYDPRRVLVLVSLAQAVVAVVLAFAAGTGLILVLAVLLGVGFAIAQPAEFALVPRVAGEARLALANGRVETARYAGFAVGPLLGGVLAAAGGLEVAMLVNAATFLVVGTAAIIVRCPHSEFCLAPEPAVGRAWSGARYLVQDRLLGVVMTVAFVSLLFMTTNWAANVFFAKDDLGLGDVGYGLLLTSWTLGMVLGATLLPRRIASSVLAVGALVAIVVQGAGLAGPAVWLVPALAFAFFFIGGLAHGTKNVLIRTLIHERVPSSLHGRAFAAYNGLRNGAELIALVAGGLLVAAIGARWTMLVAGAIPMIAGLVALVLARGRLSESTTTLAAAETESARPWRADSVVPVDDEFRVEVELDDDEHGYSLRERLRALDLDDEARARLGKTVIVTRDGPRIFAYTSTEPQARAAEGVVRELLGDERLTADISVTRWHPIAEEWRDASLPLPDTPAEEEREYAEREAAERREAEVEGRFDWHVVVELGARDAARDLGQRLSEEGLSAKRRWRYVTIGAVTEERAEELAARLRGELGDSADVRVDADLGEVAAGPFQFVGF